jgi:hypothetical protein
MLWHLLFNLGMENMMKESQADVNMTESPSITKSEIHWEFSHLVIGLKSIGNRLLCYLENQTCNCNADIVMYGSRLILGMDMYFDDVSLNSSKSRRLDISFTKPHEKPIQG